jgi:hypothetical protein
MLNQQEHDNGKNSGGDDDPELDRDVIKWPKKPVLLDTDLFEVDDSWHDMPPEGFSLTVSIIKKGKKRGEIPVLLLLIRSQHDVHFFSAVCFRDDVGRAIRMDIQFVFGLCVWA